MVKKYLIKRSQVVAILIFLVEIIGSFALVQIDASENILGKIGYVAIIYGVLSTIALYQVKKEWDVFLIFMIMCYLFSFGQCILTAFGYKLGVFAFSMDRGFFSNQEILNATYNDSYIYVERKLKNGAIRKGIVGAIDLEDYDYKPNAKSKIRATEKTVVDRIPPRVKIRENANIELPHILLLCDDQKHQLLESIETIKEKLEILYDFDLMQDGGHITGWLVSKDKAEIFDTALEKYLQDIREKYYGLDENPMIFAVGDGNHSLATAKECYEQQKKAFGTSIKARYALVELENLQDESQQFEPIHRLLMNVDISDFLTKIKTICVSHSKHKVEYYTKEKQGVLYLDESLGELTVGILQRFLDDYVKTNNCDIDYIHDDDVLKKLSCKSDCIGLLLSAIDKENLFSEIIKNGSLPRKTFSMGHAQEKRYYIEARRIK